MVIKKPGRTIGELRRIVQQTKDWFVCYEKEGHQPWRCVGRTVNEADAMGWLESGRGALAAWAS